MYHDYFITDDPTFCNAAFAFCGRKLFLWRWLFGWRGTFGDVAHFRLTAKQYYKIVQSVGF